MNEHALADVNGVITPLNEARISILDRGFLFGDAVYEVVRIFQGAPFHLEAHLDRLVQSAEGLQFSQFPTCEDLYQRATALLEQSAVHDGALYFQVTRGKTDKRGQFPDASVSPTVVITVEPRPPNPESLYSEGVRTVTRREERWLRADLKTVNLIPRILARRQAMESGAWEILWTSHDDDVLEGGSTNVFAVIDGKLVTPPLGERILAGITRQDILYIAEKESLEVDCRSLSLQECLDADECFLTGTTTEVLAISHIDEHSIGGGKPGAITRRLRTLLLDRMRQASELFHSEREK